jgi:acetamidase/formamidase
MKLEWPRAGTPTHWITMGTDTSLVVATKTAIREMVRFLQEKKGLTETQAYQAASMAADLPDYGACPMAMLEYIW